MYKVIICTANLQHKPWWKGKSRYSFNSIDDVIKCLKEIFPQGSIREWEFDNMKKYDTEKENGCIACTSWYEIIKGELQMTEYTSF